MIQTVDDTVHSDDHPLSRIDCDEYPQTFRKSRQVSNSRIRTKEKLTRKHRVDHLECLVYLFADFGTSQDNLAADKDQKDNLGLYHAIDETGEQFRLVRAEVVMAASQAFEANGKLDVA